MKRGRITEQICDLLGLPIRGQYPSDSCLRKIRNCIFTNLMNGAGYGPDEDPLKLLEDWPWIEEILKEDAEAKKEFADWCRKFRQKHKK